MHGRPYAPVVLLVSLLSSAAAQSLAPEVGLLVLKNGYVIEGEITRAGDYYLVTRGEGTELRPKAEDVECVCASLQEAYEFKARRVSGSSSRPRLELAKWCLRQNLLPQCREQLQAVEQAEPGLPQTRELLSRLAFLEETPAPLAAASAAPLTPVESVEKALTQLPRGSLERFSTVVQPILLNRCAANQCHGPNSKSEFKLLRAPAGQIVSRRFTQRNLYVTLRQLDPANPDRSPLLVKAEQRHGNSLSPIFDKQSAAQLNELAAWARLAVGASPASANSRAEAAPPSPSDAQPTLQSAAAGVDFLAKASDHAKPSAPVVPGAAVSPSDTKPGVANAKSAATPPAPAFRDRFDPEIFNQRFHRR